MVHVALTSPLHYIYDTANRLVTDGQNSTTENHYRYDPYNRKVWACKANGLGCFLYLYGPDGLLAEFKIRTGDPDLRFDGTEYVYFGGRQVMKVSWSGLNVFQGVTSTERPSVAGVWAGPWARAAFDCQLIPEAAN